MLRKPDSISANDILIEDTLIEPFFITKSPGSGYTLFERVETGKDSNQYIKTVGYFSNFGNCLKRISKELISYKTQDRYSSIKDYLKTYSELESQIRTLTEI